MLKSKEICGISIIESMVCIVIIGIGFIAILQLSAFSIGSMDRATEKNKLNYLSEMVMEDMIGDPDNVTSYGGFIKLVVMEQRGEVIFMINKKISGEINFKKKII